jgi:iron complex outermembrane receptor protein
VIATNDTKGEAHGGEIIASWRPLTSLNLSAAYSYLEIRLDGPPSTEAINSEGAEGESPQHQLNLRSMWDVTDDLTWDTVLYFVDDLPTPSVDDYWRLDVRFAYRVLEDVELSLAAQNLLDNAHPEFGTIKIQRSVYGKVTWEF